ncbi:hypothetical protein CPB86DRAFT_786451 [Serendipita vermifera]|nr:hypothetical protein CPB86DRAFT_786451 [Serendipita vermifera]
MIRNPSTNVPAQPQAPVMAFDPSSLPLTHIVSLRSKLSQIIDSLNSLTYTIDGEGRPGMSSWPEILSKYNNLLAQSHTLITTLSGAHIPQPARRPGEAKKEKINAFETIAFHPLMTAGNMDEAHHGMLENLLRTEPHPDVIKRWDETVRRFVDKRGGLGDSRDVIKEMTQFKEDHDARVKRASDIVESLRDRWDWKMRISDETPGTGEDLFGDESEPEEEDWKPSQIKPMDLEKADEPMLSQSQPQTQMSTTMQEDPVESRQPPPPTQQTAVEDEKIFSDEDDDSDDDDDLEDVMET